jgi:hypothetical protein
MTTRTTILTIALLLAGSPAAAAGKYHHQTYMRGDFEGTKTCLECHREEAEQFISSQHYQWEGATPDLVNADGQRLGKMSMINDFCTNPSGHQWIGEVKNADGKVLAKGCSSCHAGLGKLPGKEITDEELENVDCLICHASGYRRNLYPTDDGGWEWKSILWKNQEGLNSVAKRISAPTRTMCLRCHSASGGGPNYKRGDLEYVLKDPERSFDVHMAGEGGDLSCADCHGSDDHRVRGHGVDLVANDAPGDRLTCDGDCHGVTPHEDEDLNRHAVRVDCASCHIPTFAKEDPTDMRRDWSDVSYSEEKGKHVYSVELASNVVPVYAWHNGENRSQLPGQPVERNELGEVIMAAPIGSRDDPNSKIKPFKLHKGVLPVLDDRQWLVPIGTEEFYAHGDIDRAVREGAEYYYGLDDIDYSWTETSRYMGIYHEVVPKEDALKCKDCHGRKTRLDWEALGYEGDPSRD